MAARVVTVTSGKGGVGKTTTTANIAVALAALGNRVVCVDADIGLRNLDVVMGLENRIVYDIVDVVEGRARLRQAMIKDKRLQEELYLIPAAQTRDKTALSPSDMVRLCDELRELVDFIVIDSPAGIERGFRNAVAPADEVLVVTNPEVSAVRDADRIIGLLEAENKGPGRLIINRVKPDMVKKGDMISPEDVIDILAIELIGMVPEDESILISTNRGTPAALNAAESPAGRAFIDIARRLMGEVVPFEPLEDNRSLIQRVFGRFKRGQPGADSSKPDRKATAAPTERTMSQKPDDSKKKDANDEANEEATEVAELAAIDSEELLKGGRALKKEGVARTQIGEDLLEGGAEKKEKAKKAADEAAGLPGFLAKKEAASKQAAKKQAAEDDPEDEIPLEGARPDEEPGIGTEGEVKLEKPDDSASAKPDDNSSAPEAKKTEASDEKAGAAKASGTEKQKDTP